MAQLSDSEPPVLAVVLKGYPRLSETFIAQELHALERKGFDLRLFSLRHPTDKSVHPVHERIAAPVNYLPEYLYQEPLRVLRAWRRMRRRAGYPRALRAFRKDFRRDFTVNRIRRFGQALVMANELAPEITWIHAHFLHTPASVARYAAKMIQIPWSCSAHARDIWTSPQWEKEEKIADMDWLVTCTAGNLRHLQGLAAEPEKVQLMYHGLDFSRFADPRPRYSPRRGNNADEPVRILSVGRAVEKKGYDILLEALARLPEDLHWRFTHVGGGGLLERLKTRARELGLMERILWSGPLAHESVIGAYRDADLFVLACLIAGDGDRDGLPNVLMEAQSQGLVCVATTVSGIPELIIDGETGVLVAPDNAGALCDALAALIVSPDRRQALGSAGKKRVQTHFAMDAGIERLVKRFYDSNSKL